MHMFYLVISRTNCSDHGANVAPMGWSRMYPHHVHGWRVKLVPIGGRRFSIYRENIVYIFTHHVCLTGCSKQTYPKQDVSTSNKTDLLTELYDMFIWVFQMQSDHVRQKR